jgi:hypothetical protein
MFLLPSSTVLPPNEVMMTNQSKFHLFTLSMEDSTVSMRNATQQFLDFVLGVDDYNNNKASIIAVSKRL